MRTFYRLMRAAGLLLALGCSGLAAENPFGVWWRGGPDAAGLKKKAPYVKGVFASIKWRDLEPADNQFDWKLFRSALEEYADAGLYIQFMVMVGPDAPRWIFDAGVPQVKTTPTLNPRGEPHFSTYPFYLDENYKRYYHRMIREVAGQHRRAARRRCATESCCIQTAEGSTGDEGGYKGEPLDPRYELPEDKWRAFKFETWKLFDQLYRPKKPPIHVLTNSGNQGQYDEWLRQNLPHWWRKAGNPGHGYQLNNEKDMMAFFDPLINHPESGKLIRARSEMDEMFKGWFQEAPVWNMYWLNLWGLHFGLDILQHQTNAFDRRHREGLPLLQPLRRPRRTRPPVPAPGARCATVWTQPTFSAFRRRHSGPANCAAAAGTGRRAQAHAQHRQGIRALRRGAGRSGKGHDGGDAEPQRQTHERCRLEHRSGQLPALPDQYDPNGTSQGYWRVGPRTSLTAGSRAASMRRAARTPCTSTSTTASSAASRSTRPIRCASASCTSIPETVRGS